MGDAKNLEAKNLPRTLTKWLAIGALAGATSGCAALPALEAGGAILSGLANFDTLREKIASLLQGSDEAAASAQRGAAPQLIASGDTARAQGDASSAAWDYAQAVAADPKSKDAQLHLGAAELSLGDDAGAYVAYRAAFALDSADSEAPLRMGEIELARGDTTSALNHFSRALHKQQKDPKLYNAMGVAFTMEEKYDLARQSFDTGLSLKPGYPALLNNYGLMQLQSGDLTTAYATFTALVASADTNERYRTNRALVELAMGDTEAALRDAPKMDEAGLRRMLVQFVPAPGSVRAAADIHLQVAPGATVQQTDLPTARATSLPQPKMSQNYWHPTRGAY